ncbi:MAG: ABC transporter permease [Gemmataceae bacterium]|nr:ABC transporter permease [Gemmataceae bacterium]
MRLVDVVGLGLSALLRQKVRTLLTTLGVLFGSFVLVASLSVRQGVHETIAREYQKYGELRKIEVRPTYGGTKEIPPEKLEVRGTMSEERRQRLRQEIQRRWKQGIRVDPAKTLTRERMKEIAALDHVKSVEPVLLQHGRVTLGKKSMDALSLAAPPDSAEFRNRLMAGSFLPSADSQSVVVTEYLLYQLGIVDDADVERAPGKTLELEYRLGRPAPSLLLTLMHGGNAQVSPEEEKVLEKVLQRLPDAFAKLDLGAEERATVEKLFKPRTPTAPEGITIREPFAIAGVLRCGDGGGTEQRWGWVAGDVDVLVPSGTATEMYFRSPRHREHGFDTVIVEVDDLTHVKAVNQQILAMGLQTVSLVDLIEREQFSYLLIFSSMTVVAVVALMVAALGITNTMLMSVLERIREIGIMKAVGAREGHIQTMFLVEGALIGVVGGLLGLLMGWVASFPADAWVRSMIEQQISIKLEESIFVFPPWLVFGTPLFSVVVTTLAAFYPARRAARVNPIAALRHD